MIWLILSPVISMSAGVLFGDFGSPPSPLAASASFAFGYAPGARMLANE
jgi:hypothetical protein